MSLSKIGMMKKVFLLYLCVLFIGLASCDDFLEEYSQNQVYAETAQDLNELLIGECFMSAQRVYVSNQGTMSTTGIIYNYPWLHVMDDDSEEFLVGEVALSVASLRNVLGAFHHWKSDPFSTLENKQYKDNDWERFYGYIAVLNSIIYRADELRSKEKDIELLDKVEGEARFLRAGYYFLLVNIYGKPYCKATANKDGGVPLKISEVIEDKYFSRDPVGAVYAQMVTDLKRATTCLENVVPVSSLRVSSAAAQALLSRVYLYMEEYELAVTAADEVLADSYDVLDLNNWSAGKNVIYRNSLETIFTQGGNSIPVTFLNDSVSPWNGDDRRASSYQVSDDLLACYDPSDLRRNAFFKFSAKTRATLPSKYRTWNVADDKEQVGEDFLIRLPEVILNKAEALAMLKRDDEAKIELQKIRSKRFKAADLKPVIETGEDLVNFIREERRRELCFEGHRWFDLRRYAVNSIYPLSRDFSIKHQSYSYEANTQTWYVDGYYELNSYADDEAAWIVPIPNYAIEFNKGSLQNEIRPTRDPKRD